MIPASALISRTVRTARIIRRSRKTAAAIADRMEKLWKKYREDSDAGAMVWEWEMDDYYDAENPDVLNMYGC